MPTIPGFYTNGFLVQPGYLSGNQFPLVRKKTDIFANGKFTERYKLAGLLKEFNAVNHNVVQGIQLFEAEALGHFSKPVDSIITQWRLHGNKFLVDWQNQG